MALVSAFR